MTAVELIRLAGLILCAAGLAALLAAPRFPAGAALGATLGGWLALITTLAPAATRLPVVICAGLAGGALLRVGALMLRRPLLWFAAIGATVAIRVPVSIGGQKASLLAPLYVVLLLGVGMFLASPQSRGTGARFPTVVGRPLGAVAGWLVLSAVWTSDPTEGAIRAACYIVPFALAAWLVVTLWPGDGALAWLCAGFGAVALCAAAVAIGQGLTGRTFGNAKLEELHAAGATFRANGFLYDPNMLGRLMVVALIMLIGAGFIATTRSGREPLALACAATLLTVALVLTVSQSSGLALVAGTVVLLGRTVGWRRILVVGGLLGVVTVIWGVVGTGPAHDALASQERIARASDGRDRLVDAGIGIWREHPVVGSGLGSFAEQYRATLSPQERLRATLFTSHTAPVTVLAEGGLVGFGLLSWLGLATILALRAPGRGAWARWVVLAVLAAIATHSLLYAALLEDPLTWVALAVGTALTLQPPRLRPAPAVVAVSRRVLVAS